MKSGAELINPYDNERDKGEQIEEMFDSIAPAYDFMNTAMSFGLHRNWRSRALKAVTKSMQGHNPGAILDIATGTGDVAFDLQRRFPDSTVTGIDLSENMLEEARKKLEKRDENAKKRINFEKGDSLNLRFGENSFDLVTVAYGVRNFEHLDKGLSEMSRVLRDNGRICIIELSEPTFPLNRALYRFYSRYIIPFIGRIVSGDSRAYSYLPESIAAAPQRERLTKLMNEAGFEDCSWKSLTMGVVTYYIGVKKEKR